MDEFLAFLQTNWYWILAGIAGLILVLKFIPRYRIAPPDKALIISGLIALVGAIFGQTLLQNLGVSDVSGIPDLLQQLFGGM